MDVQDMLDEVKDLAQRAVEDDMVEIKPEQAGLDDRAGYRLRINGDYIAVDLGLRRMLDYYGGFEYVDEECIEVVGNWVFYSRYDGRVADHIAEWENNDE